MVRRSIASATVLSLFSAGGSAQTIPHLVISPDGNVDYLGSVASESVAPSGWARDELFQPMVKMSLFAKKHVDGTFHRSPVAAAQDAFDLVSEEVATGGMTAGNIGIVFYFSADDNPFFDAYDKIFPRPWPATVNTPHTDQSIQPWMHNGVDRFEEWMQQFVATYNELSQDPTDPRPDLIPTQIHFDNESAITAFDENCMISWRAFVQDSRFKNPASLVKGFGTTLEQVYLQAASQYGFPTDPLEAVLLNRGYSDPLNQRFNLWWMHTCSRIMDAANKEAFFDVVHNLWPTCKVSNYDYNNVDGEFDTGSWRYRGWDNARRQSGPLTRHIYHVQRTGAGGAGTDFEPLLGNNSNQVGVWYCHQMPSSGDLLAPALYLAHPDHMAPDPYRTGTLYQESQSTASIRLHRDNVESIINSDAGNAAKLSPWMCMRGSQKSSQYHAPNRDDTRHQFSFFRSKAIERAIIFESRTSTPSLSDWISLKEIFWQAYAPRLRFLRRFEAPLRATSAGIPCTRGKGATSRLPVHEQAGHLQS
jgi:hypothetical protein